MWVAGYQKLPRMRMLDAASVIGYSCASKTDQTQWNAGTVGCGTKTVAYYTVHYSVDSNTRLLNREMRGKDVSKLAKNTRSWS
jgi:hypothetical protein